MSEDFATRSLGGEDTGVPAGSRVGERFGPYEVVRHIGAGGMGDVYLAHRADGEFERDVAIKVVKRGMDTDLILGRFHAERRILAGLEHPNVCHLLDGGSTADGLPYFVMEHIDGEPIDGYCRWHALTLARRLDLFRGVCSAVGYAHQNLVVHCDIKPGNILVTADGTPKLVDFGIAKLLGEPWRATVARSRPWTPAFASPEQVRGAPITTATDVHALGILLYQLLADRHPFAFGDRDVEEVERAILEEDPAPPSQVAASPRLRRALRGDLDTIVLRALHKDPARRYPSAGELYADIERQRSGHPILARRDALGYRAGKFVGRHRLGVAAATAVFLSLVGGIVTTTWQARVARRERARAEQRFHDLRRMANELVFDVNDAVADLPGSTAARKLLIERGTTILDSLAAEDLGDPALQRERMKAYLRYGDLQGSIRARNLGDFAGAQASLDKGMAIVEDLLRRDPWDVKLRLEHARYLDRLADLRSSRRGDHAGAMAQMQRALAEAEAVLVEHPDNTEARLEIAIYEADLADELAELGQRPEALARYRASLAHHQALAAAGATAPQIARNIPGLMEKIGDALVRKGDLDGALAQHREALVLREAQLARQPRNPWLRRLLATNLSLTGNVLLARHDLTGAEAVFQRAYDLDREAAASDAADAEGQRDVAIDLLKLADVSGNRAEVETTPELARDRWREAAAHFGEALARFRDIEARGHLQAKDASVLIVLPTRVLLCEDLARVAWARRR